MPRKYIRKTITRYTRDDLLKAIEAYENKTLKLKEIVTKYRVPKTTLLNNVEKLRKNGRPSFFNVDEEKILVETIVSLSQWGFGMDKKAILAVVRNFVETNESICKYSNFKGGIEWFNGFMNRWKQEISQRTTENFSISRITACNQQTIDNYFDLLKQTVESLDVKDKPCNIWNCDESGFVCNTGVTKIICKRGERNVIKVTPNNEKDCYTVLSCCNANGDYLPPLIIFEAKHLWSSWVKEGPKDASFNVSDSGWMDESVFYNWFEKVFVENTRSIEGNHLLILDGHSSHLSYRLVELTKSNNVGILCLPAHTTHLLQPLDVSVFKPMKSVWKEILTNFFKTNGYRSVDKPSFTRLFKLVTERGYISANAKAGFYKCGIYPYDPTKIDSTKIKPAEVFQSSSISSSTSTPVASTSTQSSSSISSSTSTPVASTSTQSSSSISSSTSTPVASTSTQSSSSISSSTSTPVASTSTKSNRRDSLSEAILQQLQVNVTIVQQREKKSKITRQKAECLTSDEAIKRLKNKENEKTINKRKRVLVLESDDELNDNPAAPEPPKRKRGRPRKNPIPATDLTQSDATEKPIEESIRSCCKCQKAFSNKLRTAANWMACEGCNHWVCFVSVGASVSSDEFLCSHC